MVKEAGFVSLFQEKGRTLDNYGGGLQLFVPLHQLGPHEKYLWKSARIKSMHIQVH